MPMLIDAYAANPAREPVGQDPEVFARIRAEFTEMPGLKLTLRQAARLFNLEAGRCERLLGALVEAGTLASIAGAFVRADSGRRYV